MRLAKWFRLKSAYIVRCDSFTKDEAGNLKEIHCSYIPETKSGHDTSNIKVKGTIHWVSVPHAGTAEIRLYERLFKAENPAMEEGDFKEYINPDSLHIIDKAYIEPSLQNAKSGDHFQFMRNGYFFTDKDSRPGELVFNRTVTLKDSFKQ